MTEQNRKILIVDDEKSIRQSLSDYFEDRHWQTFKAQSGEQAIELLKTETVDVAVVDIRLKGIDGDFLIREILRRNRDMAFLICTGSTEYVVPADLQNLPCVCSRVFRKPVDDLGKLENMVLQLIAPI
ncbi:MAG: response regulator [Proteobacteria bacterium]|nr:response regulator [Pseudomonadota bacterium]